MMYIFRFEIASKNLVVTLHKGDSGAWIVGKEVSSQWRSVCETELFDYAKHVFDVEVAKAEIEVQYEMKSC